MSLDDITFNTIMGERVFNFYFCSTHNTIFGFQFPDENANYASKCSGDGCIFHTQIGFIVLDIDNIAVYFEINIELESKINSGLYNITMDTVLDHLYNSNDSLVYVCDVQSQLHLRLHPHLHLGLQNSDSL